MINPTEYNIYNITSTQPVGVKETTQSPRLCNAFTDIYPYTISTETASIFMDWAERHISLGVK